MSERSRERCSVAARRAADPLTGTAPPARRWLLVEHPGPWGRAGYAGSGLAPPVVRGLHRWAESTGGRVVLVRRPGRSGRQPGDRRRWFLVDSRCGHEDLRTGTFADERDLIGLAGDGAPAADTSGGGEPRPDGSGAAAGPLVLVCTHGRHDTCCAIHGRPAAAALAERRPERVWECSHIGGCRFSPAVVLLPHGLVYGGIPEDEVGGVVDRYHDGVLDTRWLRGRSSLSPVEQAAQQAAWSHHAAAGGGPLGLDALRPVSVAGDSAEWRVRLAAPDCVVNLAERRTDLGRPLTCAMTATGWQRVFDTVAVLPAPAARPGGPSSTGAVPR